MKIQHLFIATLGMCSSALTWANNANVGDLISPTMQPASSNWENVATTIPTKSSAKNMQLTNEGNVPNGSLKYTINHPSYTGYDFEVQVVNGTYCKVNDQDSIVLNGNGSGPADYRVSVSGVVEDQTLVCDVDVTFLKENPIVPRLTLEHMAQLDLGEYLSKNVSVKKVLPFNLYKNGKYAPHLAVVVDNAANDRDAEEVGTYIYEVSVQDGAMSLTLVDSITVESAEDKVDIPTAVAFFTADGGTNQYLAIGYYGTTADDSKMVIYKWDHEGGQNSFELEQTITDGLDALTDIKVIEYADGERGLVAANGGDQDRGYHNKTSYYRYTEETGDKFVLFTDKSTASYNGYNAVAFSGISNNYYGAINRNNNTSKQVETYLYGTSFEQAINTCDATHLEYFNMNGEDNILIANNCEVGSNQYVASQRYQFNGEKFATRDTISYTETSKPAANWETLKIDENTLYFFAGFASTVGNTQDVIYGWCEMDDDGSDATKEWCNNGGDGNIRPYMEAKDIPSPNNVTSFKTTQWDQMQIDGELYMLRFDDTSKTKANVQVLKASVK